jgi:hypothetical protein
MQQDWQHTYNVILKCIHATIVAVEKCDIYVAFDIQHAMFMCHIVHCGLPGSTIFFHIIT